jgi:Rieske Fe-S protein
MKNPKISRRGFLVGGGIALGGLLGCATAITYQAIVVDDRIAIPRLELERLEAVGKPVVVKTPELPHPIILIPVDADNFRAVSAECTHLGCDVRPSQNFLVCPCHGSTFDMTGEVVRGPAPSGLDTYPVEIKGDRIEIILF